MSLEPPATIAILGATPLGIEAALYARFLGYQVEMLDPGEALAPLLARGSEPLPRPADEQTSPLGLAALAAQDSAYRAPAAGATWTCQDWARLYLAPLLKSDLLEEVLRPRCQVVGIAAELTPPPPAPDAEDDDEREPGFTLTFRDAASAASQMRADAVLVADLSLAQLLNGLPADTRLARLDPADESFPAGLARVRDLFAALYGRADLDLYARMGRS